MPQYYQENFKKSLHSSRLYFLIKQLQKSASSTLYLFNYIIKPRTPVHTKYQSPLAPERNNDMCYFVTLIFALNKENLQENFSIALNFSAVYRSSGARRMTQGFSFVQSKWQRSATTQLEIKPRSHQASASASMLEIGYDAECWYGLHTCKSMWAITSINWKLRLHLVPKF